MLRSLFLLTLGLFLASSLTKPIPGDPYSNADRIYIDSLESAISPEDCSFYESFDKIYSYCSPDKSFAMNYGYYYCKLKLERQTQYKD